jgi:hypothetical protein
MDFVLDIIFGMNKKEHYSNVSLKKKKFKPNLQMNYSSLFIESHGSAKTEKRNQKIKT